jgi:hypothetical protein
MNYNSDNNNNSNSNSNNNHSTTLTTTPRTLDRSSATVTTSVEEEEEEKEEYISYFDFCQKYPDHPAAIRFVASSSFSSSSSSYSQRVSTRSPFVVNELLLTHLEGLSLGSPSLLTSTGRLSDNSSYCFELDHSSTSFLGMKVSHFCCCALSLCSLPISVFLFPLDERRLVCESDECPVFFLPVR